jgi:hypothetical protein
MEFQRAMHRLKTIKRIKLASLHQMTLAPAGYIARILESGAVVGDEVEIDRSVYRVIALQYRGKSKTVKSTSVEPTVADMATNAGYAAWRATQSLLRGDTLLVDAEIYAARADACNACEYWDASARLGLGKCKHKKCGCTKFKRWLTTEKCPLGKWEPAPVDNPAK